MSVPVQTPVASFTANGVTTVFPYAYLLLSSGDLQVTLDGVVLTAGFTISGVGSVTGGNVTFSVAPAAGTLILRRKMSLSRLVDYVEAGDLLASTLNLDLDRIWMVMQGLQSDATRSIKLPEETLTDQTITDDAATRASKLLGFDVDGNVVLLGPFDPDTLVVTAYIETLLAASSAASARSVLGAADASIVSSDVDFGSSLALVSSGGGTVGGYTTKVGRGFTVGTRFFFNLTVTLSSLGTLAAGDVSIQSLPVTSDPAANSRTAGTCFASSLSAGIASPPQWDIVEGASTLRLFKFSAGGLTRLRVSDLTATSLIRITGFVELAP